jgi:hypothetical protein
VNTPAVNVNLAKCDCPDFGRSRGTPYRPCPAVPVFIPLPLPRSVTFQVVLGECSGACTTINDTRGYRREVVHDEDCPARPVKVSCSISGKTWAESEVTDAWPEKNDGFLCSTGQTFPTLEAVCRDRWSLVKALVLGQRITSAPVPLLSMAGTR